MRAQSEDIYYNGILPFVFIYSASILTVCHFDTNAILKRYYSFSLYNYLET